MEQDVYEGKIAYLILKTLLLIPQKGCFLLSRNPLLIPPKGGKYIRLLDFFAPLGEMPRSGRGGLLIKQKPLGGDAAKRQRGFTFKNRNNESKFAKWQRG
jgi:hypothetical protein